MTENPVEWTYIVHIRPSEIQGDALENSSEQIHVESNYPKTRASFEIGLFLHGFGYHLCTRKMSDRGANSHPSLRSEAGNKRKVIYVAHWSIID